MCLYTTDTIVSVGSKYILFELRMVDGSALSRCAPTLKAQTRKHMPLAQQTTMPHMRHMLTTPAEQAHTPHVHMFF